MVDSSGPERCSGNPGKTAVGKFLIDFHCRRSAAGLGSAAVDNSAVDSDYRRPDRAAAAGCWAGTTAAKR